MRLFIDITPLIWYIYIIINLKELQIIRLILRSAFRAVCRAEAIINMNYSELADVLYPSVQYTPEQLEEMYPPRKLPEGAGVTRFAPSPTGYVHFGGLYQAVVDERIAHRSGGVFYLRIEDTDQKREIADGIKTIVTALDKVGVHFDEGADMNGGHGDYGPYVQSQRKEIYKTYAKKLVSEGKAYPCFCSADELTAIRAQQESEKADPGYYGKWAVWRDAPIEKIQQKLDAGVPFMLRFRCDDGASPEHKFKFNDQIKGEVEITENDRDHIIMKSDGTPPYAFAHAIDDHLMRTTHVVRGEEWLPSLPFHILLFKALGFKLPKYCHTALVLKLENGNKVKLSKRRHPEAALDYYISGGFPNAALRDYILTLLNSNFEEWRAANPVADADEFPFSTKKMPVSGSLFDSDKLSDICKTTVSRMSAKAVYDSVCAWAEEYNAPFAALLKKNEQYALSILSIGRGGKKPRKDFGQWSEVKNYVSFFYDGLFCIEDSIPDDFAASDVSGVLKTFADAYDPADDQNAWFEKIKQTAQDFGFCPDMKEYKLSPESYKGSVADVSMFIRVAVTGRLSSPDLYAVMQILGAERVRSRLLSYAVC